MASHLPTQDLMSTTIALIPLATNLGEALVTRILKYQLCISLHHATVWIAETHGKGDKWEEWWGVQIHVSSQTTPSQTLAD